MWGRIVTGKLCWGPSMRKTYKLTSRRFDWVSEFPMGVKARKIGGESKILLPREIWGGSEKGRTKT